MTMLTNRLAALLHRVTETAGHHIDPALRKEVNAALADDIGGGRGPDMSMCHSASFTVERSDYGACVDISATGYLVNGQPVRFAFGRIPVGFVGIFVERLQEVDRVDS